MSTESGVPDFRSKEGFYAHYDPSEVASVGAIKNHYETFHHFYQTRIEALKRIKPHKGHEILAKWEAEGRIDLIATQNIDRLHHLAGSGKVYELHGNIRTFRCAQCAAPADEGDFLSGKRCVQCCGPLRPNVVLFGEMLPQEEWRKTVTAIKESDLVIIIGTSLNVTPFNQLPFYSPGKKVLLNMEPTILDHSLDLLLFGKAGELIQTIDSLLI